MNVRLRRLRHEFSGHDGAHRPGNGLGRQKERRTLQLMAGQAFEVLVTVGQNLCHQQNLQAAGVAVIVLVAGTNRLADLLPLMPSARAALATLKPGDVVEIDA